MEVNGKDWRIFEQDQYLRNRKFKYAKFSSDNIEIDHAHCDFCWAKFSKYPGDLHEGYVTLDGKYWICKNCFEDFREMFHLIVSDQCLNDT